MCTCAAHVFPREPGSGVMSTFVLFPVWKWKKECVRTAHGIAVISALLMQEEESL